MMDCDLMVVAGQVASCSFSARLDGYLFVAHTWSYI